MITLHTIIYGDFYKKQSFRWFEEFWHPLITDKFATVTNPDDGFRKSDYEFRCERIKYENLFFDPYIEMTKNLTTDYVLHVAADCMGKIHIDNSFFTDSLAELENDRCIATIANWGCDPQGEEDSSNRILGRTDTSARFYRRVNFTDQFFFAKTDTLIYADYSVPSSVARRIYGGPSYGVNSFEERLVGYQINSDSFNSVHKGPSYYVHRS